MKPRFRFFFAALASGACQDPPGPPAVPTCDVGQPGVFCGVTVGFSPYVTNGPFRTFHGVDDTTSQPDITINFSDPVSSVIVTALAPDGPNSRMIAYDSGDVARDTAYFDGDADPSVYTTSTATVSYPGISRIVLQTDPSDPHTAYTRLRFTNAAGTCDAGRPGPPGQPFCGGSVTFSPYETGSPYQTFQSVGFTVAQAPETLTFSHAVSSVTVTAMDPDLSGNRMVAYNALGLKVDGASFDGDGSSNTYTTSTKTVTGRDIRMVVLRPAAGEYIAYTLVRFTP